MADTTFTDGVTLTAAAWFNDINDLYYTLFASATTAALARTAIVSGIKLVTSQASTSGTAIDFTGIPAGANRVTVMFVGVSSNGTGNFSVQIGDVGGIENTAYVTVTTALLSEDTSVTSGFPILAGSAATSLYGIMELNRQTGNTWLAMGTFRSAGGVGVFSSGGKALSAELDRVRVIAAGDTFDAGAISISYELGA